MRIFALPQPSPLLERQAFTTLITQRPGPYEQTSVSDYLRANPDATPETYYGHLSRSENWELRNRIYSMLGVYTNGMYNMENLRTPIAQLLPDIVRRLAMPILCVHSDNWGSRRREIVQWVQSELEELQYPDPELTAHSLRLARSWIGGPRSYVYVPPVAAVMAVSIDTFWPPGLTGTRFGLAVRKGEFR